MSVVLNAVTPPIGNFTLEAGGALSTVVSVPGATVGSMSVSVSPETFPGDGIYWQGFVSAPDQVTVKIGRTIAGYVPASVYNINVLTGDGGGAASPVLTASVTMSANDFINSNPVDFGLTVPAGMNAIPCLVAFFYEHNTVAFNADGLFILNWAADLANQISNSITLSLNGSLLDISCFASLSSQFNGELTSNMRGQSIVVTQVGAATVGDGTIKCFLSYYLIQG